MVAINPLAREVTFKVVFYGPGLGGKTTSLQVVHDKARPEHRGKMVSLATPIDRTLYFDYLPYRVPPVRGMGVRLQLFTVPGQVHYNATRKLVLAGADGVVFVADSQSLRADANLESFENLRDNLVEQRRELEAVPLVFQYNKRDLPDVLAVEQLERMLNPKGAPAVPSVAVRGEGVFETLDIITQKVLEAFERRPSRAHSPPPVPLASAGEGLADALRAIGSEVAAAAASNDAAAASDDAAASNGGGGGRAGVLAGRGEAAAGFGDGGEAARVAGFGDGGGAARAAGEGEDDITADPVRAAEILLGARLPSEPSPPSDPLLEVDAERADGAAPANEGDEGEGPPTAAVPPLISSGPPPRISSGAPPRVSSSAPESGEMTTLAPASFSFAELWPRRERDAVLAAEGAMAAGDYRRAVELLDGLASRTTLAAVSLVGVAEAGAAATAFAPLLLGVNGPRYAAFRALVRHVRAGGSPEPKQALAAYALVVDLVLAKEHISPTAGASKPGERG
ncbi:MAG TPA: gliding motility protein [Polyangiaceae bacterium]|nr:gliding motility protein [Polyangiaceae bacterium]